MYTSPQAYVEALSKLGAFNLRFSHNPRTKEIIMLLEENLRLLEDSITLLKTTNHSKIYDLSLEQLLYSYALQMGIKLYYCDTKDVILHSLADQQESSINFIKLYSIPGNNKVSPKLLYTENEALGTYQFSVIHPILKELVEKLESWHQPYSSVYLLISDSSYDYIIQIKNNKVMYRRSMLDITWMQKYFNQLMEIKVIECWNDSDGIEPSLKFIRNVAKRQSEHEP
jgi:hypothetical protein